METERKLITLSKRDPGFQQYLLGTFSKDERALPIRSLNVDSEHERVTFAIHSLSELQVPSFSKRWSQALRLHEAPVLLAPLLMVFLVTWTQGHHPSYFLSAVSSLGAFLLFFAVILRNDFYDYTKGLDRLELSKSGRAIQKGWITAAQGLSLSHVFIALGFFLGLPALVSNPQILWLIGPFVFLGVWEFSSNRLGLKYRGLGEAVGFFLLGPALTVGFAMAVAPTQVLWPHAALGATFGWLALLVLHFKNFEKILVNSQAKVRNAITTLGFDRSKRLVQFWIFTSVALPMIFNFWSKKYITLWTLAACQICMAYFIWLRLKELRSCIGSDLRDLTHLSQVFYNLTAVWWILSWLVEYGISGV